MTLDLSTEQVRRIEQAEVTIDEAFMLELLRRMVDTPSPTGREGRLQLTSPPC